MAGMTQTSTSPCTDNRRFHRRDKHATMLDEVSLSHLLRRPSPFVQNDWTYGEALGHFILERELLPGDRPAAVVEVGGGLGDVAAGVLPVLARAGRLGEYAILDLSPELQSAQRKRLQDVRPPVRFVWGDAEKLRRVVAGADFVLSNEVIGDFRTIDGVPRTRGGPPSGPYGADDPRRRRYWDLAWKMVDRYALDVPSEVEAPSFAVNWGAIRFVEALREVLRPGGGAFLVENATPFARPLELPGHREYSIAERHLVTVLDRLGFEFTVGDAADFLHPGRACSIVSPRNVALWLMSRVVSPFHRQAWDLFNDPAVDWHGRVARLREALGGDLRIDTAMSPEAFAHCLRVAGLEVGLPETNILGRHFRYFSLRKPAVTIGPSGRQAARGV
jgi:SAM-dependent methyltransferase